MTEDNFDVSIRRIGLPDRPPRVTGGTTVTSGVPTPYIGMAAEFCDGVPRFLLITKCSDSMMWYANLVGQCARFAKARPEKMGGDPYYWTYESSGLINIIQHDDVEIVGLEYATKAGIIGC